MARYQCIWPGGYIWPGTNARGYIWRVRPLWLPGNSRPLQDGRQIWWNVIQLFSQKFQNRTKWVLLKISQGHTTQIHSNHTIKVRFYQFLIENFFPPNLDLLLTNLLLLLLSLVKKTFFGHFPQFCAVLAEYKKLFRVSLLETIRPAAMVERRGGSKKPWVCSLLSRWSRFIIVIGIMIFFLTLAFYVLCAHHCHHSSHHQIIEQTQFPNSVCQSSTTGRNGTCYTSSECTAKGWTSMMVLTRNISRWWQW